MFSWQHDLGERRDKLHWLNVDDRVKLRVCVSRNTTQPSIVFAGVGFNSCRFSSVCTTLWCLGNCRHSDNLRPVFLDAGIIVQLVEDTLQLVGRLLRLANQQTIRSSRPAAGNERVNKSSGWIVVEWTSDAAQLSELHCCRRSTSHWPRWRACQVIYRSGVN